VKLKKKLIIGFAQFSNDYLKFNKNKVSKSSLKNLINFLNIKKLFYYDSALAYKNVEKKIINTKILNKNIKVITKIIIPKIPKINYEKKIISNLKLSLKNLNLKKFEGILIHNPWDIDCNNSLFLKNVLSKIIKSKITNRVGVSVYTLKEFYKINNYFLPKIVQIPFNVFNTEFNNTKFINFVKKNKIEVHARSIFLKGIIFKNKKFLSLPNYKNLYKKIIFLKKYSQEKKMSQLEILVNFVLLHKFIDKVVVGFKSVKEIDQFLKIRIKRINKKDIMFNVPKKETDPRLWLN